MNRTIRGLEDHETQERKRLHRDVRSPSQRLADALKLGQVQIGGMFGAGVCSSSPFWRRRCFWLASLCSLPAVPA